MDTPKLPSLKRRQNAVVKALISLALLLVLYAATQLGLTQEAGKPLPPVAPGYYRVLDVADGDTFDVSMDGVSEEVRLVGVDTPETHHPRKPVQCYGREASDFTKSLIDGKSVRLEADTQQPNRDKYTRLLRYVYLEDGRELNQLLVTEGYALATNFNTEKKQELKRLQEQARAGQRGLWSKCKVTEVNGILQTNDVER